MKYSDFKKKMADRYCRKCVNEIMRINFQQRDCMYALYPNQCQKCGNIRNIVEEIRWNAKYKIVFASTSEE